MTRSSPSDDAARPDAQWPGRLWHDAAAYAERAHLGQTRRDGRTPYAAHVARVAMNVAAVFGCDDEQTLAIAWLHDTIEDTTTDYENLIDRFGKVVAEGVAALTKNAALPSEERERAYDIGLESASWRAKLVKLADALDNMRDSRDEKSASKRGRVIDRTERALRIAAADTEGRDELNRACGVVQSALETYRRGS